MGIAQIIFIVITAVVFFIAFRKYSQLRRNIFLGKKNTIEPSSERWSNVFLVAFGQKKMFKKVIPALLHFFIYAAFVITQIELIEIIIDGFLGKHRIFADSLGGFYTFIINFIEILSVLALIGTLAFLARRLVLKVDRFQNPEMKGWPKQDAILILIGELLLITGIFLMNGSDSLLQEMNPANYHDTGTLLMSSWFAGSFLDGMSQSTLVILERVGWWLHLLVVYGFILYLPFSKHLHIFLAFPNTFYARMTSRGEMDNMPAIMNEVKSMMEIPIEGEVAEMDEDDLKFGVADVMDLDWRDIMGAYSCTECGRCTQQCPANQTGKKLSPRKIMMDIRDRAEEVGEKIRSGNKEYIREDKREDGAVLTKQNFDDGKNLFDYISKEEINACTTCNACVEACPVMIHPLQPILELRRYQILTESAGPAEWTPMFTSLENSGAVWSLPDARDAWVHQLNEE